MSDTNMEAGTNPPLDETAHLPAPFFADDPGDLDIDGSLPPTGVNWSTRAAPPSPKKALIVGAIAVLVLTFGALASVFTGGNGSPPANPTSPSIKTSAGTIGATPGKRALSAIETTGEPPSDILSDFDVPAGATSVSTIDADTTSGYDRTDRFAVDLTETQVIAFFTAVLHDNNWSVVSNGPASTGSGVEILAKHGSEDGYYWEMGVDVSDTVFSAAPSAGTSTGSAATTPSGPSAPQQSTPFSVRLFEVSDDI